MIDFYTQKIIINKEQKNQRLDKALSNLINKYTRSQIKILIKNQNILKNGQIIIDASHKVKQGDEYLVNFPLIKKQKHKAENIPLNIIYQDDHIIVIDKEAGIVTHPAPSNKSGTLVNALLNSDQKLSLINENRPGIVHRLDKETSGLIVVAKNDKAHLNLANQFKEHSISRKYLALVWGMPKDQIIEGYIERNKINRKKMSLNKNKGKFSKTSIVNKQTFNICSLVECELETGRTHQVRLHLTSINCPIVGDKLYGKNKVNSFGKNKDTFHKFLILKNFQRQALHAYHLSFTHPITAKKLKFESKFPEDIKNLLDFLVKY